jgi:hypothetical protein
MFTLNAINASKLVSGPVREIGVQSRSITGTMPDGNRYESSLERDFMLLLKFDPAVAIYTPQPLSMSYQGQDGTWHRYTPDGLIEWRKDLNLSDTRPVLVEVKYREEFHGTWRAWRARFRAARNFAKSKGWEFSVFTEREIRTPLLENVSFLLPYLNRQETPETEEWLLEKLSALNETTPQDIVEMLYQDKWNQAALIPVVWRLIGERRIGCNLTEPLTMRSSIWILRG